jgi:hypothetical protein
VSTTCIISIDPLSVTVHVLYCARVVPAPVPVDLEDDPAEEQPLKPLRLVIVQYCAWRNPEGEVPRVDPGLPEVSATDGSLAHAREHPCQQHKLPPIHGYPAGPGTKWQTLNALRMVLCMRQILTRPHSYS